MVRCQSRKKESMYQVFLTSELLSPLTSHTNYRCPIYLLPWWSHSFRAVMITLTTYVSRFPPLSIHKETSLIKYPAITNPSLYAPHVPIYLRMPIKWIDPQPPHSADDQAARCRSSITSQSKIQLIEQCANVQTKPQRSPFRCVSIIGSLCRCRATSGPLIPWSDVHQNITK